MKHDIRLNTQLGSLFLDIHAEFPNEIIVISGENGAGKSTLLRCIAGLEEVSGQICMHGQQWLDSSAGFVLPTEQRKLGFVWSEAVLLPWLTVEENIVLGMDEEFANEMIVISGENGAGKSTLLRCIAGLEEVSGQICMHGQQWLDSSAGFVLPTEQRKLGFVWSEAVLLPWLTVEKNIILGVDEEGLDTVLFENIVERLEIKHLLKRKPDVLSTGEAQRVSLARAIYRKPVLLLLDEPFSAQAPDIRARLREALQGLQKQLNIPVLMVSHDTEDAKVLAHQHWRMREGKLITSKNISSFSRLRGEG